MVSLKLSTFKEMSLLRRMSTLRLTPPERMLENLRKHSGACIWLPGSDLKGNIEKGEKLERFLRNQSVSTYLLDVTKLHTGDGTGDFNLTKTVADMFIDSSKIVIVPISEVSQKLASPHFIVPPVLGAASPREEDTAYTIWSQLVTSGLVVSMPKPVFFDVRPLTSFS